jgi:hypothetical protein
MRNHHARVVLAACLTAASVAAQASGTQDTIRQTPTADEFGTPVWRRALTLDTPAQAADGTLARGAAPQEDPRDLPDYSLVGLFLEHHRDFLMRRERYNPQVELRTRYLPNQRVNDETGSFDLFGYDIDVDAPWVVTTEGYLKFGAYHTSRQYNFDSDTRLDSGDRLTDETVYGSGLKLGFGVFLDRNVFFEAETRPGAFSDLDASPHHNDFDFPSYAMVTFRPVEDVFFKIGARYNQIFEDAPWLPYLGLSWRLGDAMRIDILAPEYAEISLWPSPSTGILFGAEITGAQYHVRTSLAQREVAIDPDTQRANIQVQEVIVYGGLMHRFNDRFSAYLRGGIVTAGDYTLSSGDESRGTIEGAIDQGFFAEISFGVDW